MTRWATRWSATSTSPAAASRSGAPRRPPGYARSTCCRCCTTSSPERKASHGGGLDDLLFPTARRARRDKDNINKRVLKPVLERADDLLAERGQHPLPRGVTPHKLRHTFASILIALGRDPRYVMDQLGHIDRKFTLRA
jgi:integrase